MDFSILRELSFLAREIEENDHILDTIPEERLNMLGTIKSHFEYSGNNYNEAYGKFVNGFKNLDRESKCFLLRRYLVEGVPSTLDDVCWN